jgi:hypothetical protein
MRGSDIAMEWASRFGNHILFRDSSHNARNYDQHLLDVIVAIIRKYSM